MPNTREMLIGLLYNAEEQADKRCDFAENCDKCPANNKRIDCMDWLKADCLLSLGVTVQEWISVKEMLPQGKGEICKNVILFMDDGLVTVGWLNEDTGMAYYLDTRNDFISKVPISRCTHWMPLPQPPKGE